MPNQTAPKKGWNLFARVLQEILATRGLDLGHLDDRAYVHREKVRRLKRSLEVPKSFPLLNIEEMENVCTVFQLNRRERNRLRAALLATSIEDTLMDRIHPLDALKAAEQIFPIIAQALQSYEDESDGLAVVRKGPNSLLEDAEIDEELEDALKMIDRALLALHLSFTSDIEAEQLGRARQALEGFKAAILELDKADSSLKSSETWVFWGNEAQKGYAAAQTRITVLEN